MKQVLYTQRGTPFVVSLLHLLPPFFESHRAPFTASMVEISSHRNAKPGLQQLLNPFLEALNANIVTLAK